MRELLCPRCDANAPQDVARCPECRWPLESILPLVGSATPATSKLAEALELFAASESADRVLGCLHEAIEAGCDDQESAMAWTAVAATYALGGRGTEALPAVLRAREAAGRLAGARGAELVAFVESEWTLDEKRKLNSLQETPWIGEFVVLGSRGLMLLPDQVNGDTVEERIETARQHFWSRLRDNQAIPLFCGVLALRLGRFDDAAVHFRSALNSEFYILVDTLAEANLQLASTSVLAGTACIAAGRREEGVELLQRARAMELWREHDPGYYDSLVRCWTKSGRRALELAGVRPPTDEQTRAASQHFSNAWTRLIELDLNENEADETFLAMVERMRRDCVEVGSCLDAVDADLQQVELNDRWVRLHKNGELSGLPLASIQAISLGTRGLLMLSTGNGAEAIDLLKKSIATSTSCDAHEMLGRAYQFLGRHDEARAVFERLAEAPATIASPWTDSEGEDGYSAWATLGRAALAGVDGASTPGSAAASSKSRCFLATAACGTELAPEVLTLRRFRDAVMLSCAWGRAAVRLYESCSPPLASLVAQHAIARRLVRLGVVGPAALVARMCLDRRRPRA